MSDHDDDPLLGLLTDIAEGVAVLAERIDAIEDRMAAQHIDVSEALATIAEIATRTYYVSKPPSALPADVINSGVMDAMIERWPSDAVMQFPPSEAKPLKDLAKLSAGEIEALIRARGIIAEYATNTERLRHTRALAMLNDEMGKRVKTQQQALDKDIGGRGR
jgi:hypothetical protein